MLRLIVNSLVYGLIGLVTAPILTMIFALTVGYIFDPRCGTPGDSGGCEMGAAAAAVAMALPGFVIGVGIALFRSWRQRKA
ncbi:MAG TPA: hypothetical protein DIC56_15670 [Rhizobium sp.]|nr:hypothetical protein [Rhizobium sp.]